MLFSAYLQRERSLGGLPAEHHAVGAVEDSVGHIRRLGPGRPRLLDHALEHLGRTDDRLSGAVAASDAHLLREEDLFGRDFDAEVTSSDHHAVGRFQNFVEPLHALVVLDLRDDLDVATLVAQHLSATQCDQRVAGSSLARGAIPIGKPLTHLTPCQTMMTIKVVCNGASPC